MATRLWTKRKPGSQIGPNKDDVPKVRNNTGRIQDARGRTVKQIDPVKLHLLNNDSVIPAEKLRTISDELLPGARRQRLILLLTSVFTILFIVGGTVVYFRYFGTWGGFDPVSTAIHIVQLAVILLGPIIGFRIARQKYATRITTVILKHRHCPHCGYDIRGLKIDPSDGATVCPECGCAWQLTPSASS